MSPEKIDRESDSENEKVNHKRLSALQRWILVHAVGGMERGEIAEGYYGLKRRYRGYYTDPCPSKRQERRHRRRQRRVQPAVTRSLKRLEARGLVKLIRHGQHVKELHATAQGREVAERIQVDTKGRGPWTATSKTTRPG